MLIFLKNKNVHLTTKNLIFDLIQFKMEKQNQIDSNNKTYLQNIKNLLSIYLYHILISLKIILSSFLNRLICTFSPEKSIKNQIVLITGSGGYLGKRNSN